jgi:V/A-type H+/Na+-transporting ATPase subunit E
MSQKADTGKGKIQKICDVLKNEAIEPARQEAKEIVENAKIQANEIIENAQKQAADILEKTQNEQTQQQKVFESSLQLAKNQVIASLKQEIEKKLFNKSLADLVVKASSDIKIIKDIIISIVKVIESNGLDVDIAAYIPKAISKKDVNELIGQSISERLKDGSVELGDFAGGVKISLIDHDITVDMSDDALYQCIAKYIRVDFRDIMFKGKND